MTFSAATIVQRADHVPFSQLDDELLAIDTEQGLLYSLNETAGSVWNAIAEPTAIGDLCRRLSTSYDVDAATCQQGVLVLLGRLHDAGLLVVVGDSR